MRTPRLHTVIVAIASSVVTAVFLARCGVDNARAGDPQSGAKFYEVACDKQLGENGGPGERVFRTLYAVAGDASLVSSTRTMSVQLCDREPAPTPGDIKQGTFPAAVCQQANPGNFRLAADGIYVDCGVRTYDNGVEIATERWKRVTVRVE